jgi:hypothetical protein
MPNPLRTLAFAALVLLVLASSAPLAAQGGVATAKLVSLDEVPSVNTAGAGTATFTINDAGTQVDYDVTYTKLEGGVTQAHIHLAQTGVNGGIAVFLCSNLGNGPVGTQACPASPGHITGSFDASDIVGPSAQGLVTGEFPGLLRGIRRGYVYANVHTTLFPGGEIRGQLKFTPSP